MSESWTIVGAGLAGTLLGLELEHRGIPFTVTDVGSGSASSRVAAGIFNPLLGPRMSPDAGEWTRLEPFYRRIEVQLGVRVFHPLPLERPLGGSKASRADFPRSGPGWSARVEGDVVRIEGGGWLDIPLLLDAARARWAQMNVLHTLRVSGEQVRGRRVIWCGGLEDFVSGPWSEDPLSQSRWQGVRGDILTVHAPACRRSSIWIGSRFLLPVGKGLFRWGATHFIDDWGLEDRPAVKQLLKTELGEHSRASRYPLGAFEVVEHQWGVRPTSRTLSPLIGVHGTEPNWKLFNGFAGKGVSAIPRALDKLIALL